MDIRMLSVGKKYDEETILEGFSLEIKKGETICIMGESGCGKTTLLRILMGLEVVQSGEVFLNQARVSAVFQEDRLFEELTAVKNISMICGKRDTQMVREHLCRILPEEALEKQVRLLSGGMKRRVAIVRAVLAESDMLILDEAFTGMDRETKAEVAMYIKENLKGRILVYTTHNEEELEMLGGRKIILHKR